MGAPGQVKQIYIDEHGINVQNTSRNQQNPLPLIPSHKQVAP